MSVVRDTFYEDERPYAMIDIANKPEDPYDDPSDDIHLEQT
jgi:hypothetical protein